MGPPRDLTALLADREPTLAGVVMMADGRPVIVDPTGFRVLETSRVPYPLLLVGRLSFALLNGRKRLRALRSRSSGR